MKRLLLTIILYNIVCCLFSQVDTVFYIGDTVILQKFFPNGKVWFENRGIIGRDEYSYRFHKSYNPDGIVVFYENYDINIPEWEFFSKVLWENGNIKEIFETSEFGYKNTFNNRKGELKKIKNTYSSEHYEIVEKYKNGKLTKTYKRQYKIKPKKEKYKTINHYQGQIGDNLGVIIYENDDRNEYYVNDVLLTESEYDIYMKEHNDFLKIRHKKHYYNEYSKDSILIYSGMFRKVDLPCGYYKEYYSNGNKKIYGGFNNRGNQDGIWHYYDTVGIFVGEEIFKNGVLIKQTGTIYR